MTRRCWWSPFPQMCELLHYFCDCELKHRIEAIASFSDTFVSKLQYNQKFRYNELMLALNMSAAVTAKKTKEFRSPPQEQVRGREIRCSNGTSLRRRFQVATSVVKDRGTFTSLHVSNTNS